MIPVNTKEADVRLSKPMKSHKVLVKTTPMALQLLSKDLYTNPIRAIIREYSSNAVDAHIKAKQTKPFELTLPTLDNPNIVFRDFGDGISPDEFQQYFGTYFGTNKNTSNEFTGMMGIGNFAMLSYIDSFTIESIYHGTKYIWVMNLSEEGGQEFYEVANTPTKEPSGMRISASVHLKDINRFAEEARFVYSFYKPEEIPTTNVDLNIKQPYLRQDDFSLTQAKENSIYLVMGTAAYKINPNYYEINSLYTSQINIHMPIGSMSVNPNRETVVENDDLRKLVEPKLKKIIPQIDNYYIEKYIKPQLVGCQDWWQQVVKIKLIDSNKKNKIIERIVTLPKDIKEVYYNLDGYSQDDLINIGTYGFVNSKFRKTSCIMVGPKLIVIDIRQGYTPRMEALCISQGLSGLAFIQPKKGQVDRVIKRLKLHRDSYVLVSELPTPAVAGIKTRSTETTQDKVLKFVPRSPTDPRRNWDIDKIDLNNTNGYVVEISSFRVRTISDQMLMAFAKINKLPIYGMNPHNQKKFGGQYGNLTTLTTKEIEKTLLQHYNKEVYATLRLNSTYSDEWMLHMLREDWIKYANNKHLKKLAKEYKQYNGLNINKFTRELATKVKKRPTPIVTEMKQKLNINRYKTISYIMPISSLNSEQLQKLVRYMERLI